ncbi:MAG: hemerythrin domain-containing protein [Flavobacteriales bacterium]|nr:hemerythrin domain-containing protein [Flavobacteriales bacterium]
MKNNPIDVMLHEHEVICSTEAIIEGLDKSWEEEPEKYKSTVSTLLTFFREYADGYHHNKEEEVLFPAINDHPDFVLQEMVEEFETHHEDFREYSKVIEDAMAEEEFEESYKELNSYLQDLLDHIAAENEELFVLAESLLDESDLETIYFKFKDIDMELGEERKTELEKLIQGLK